jgi:hypothetical protein
MNARTREGRAMGAADLRAHFREWRQSAARELRILGLSPLLRPVQLATVIHHREIPWLLAEDAADNKWRALEKHLRACAGDPETLRLLGSYIEASRHAEALAADRRQLISLELDYLRTAFWRDAWRDQVI